MLALVIFLFLAVGFGLFLIITKNNETYWHGPRWGWGRGWGRGRGWGWREPAIYSDKDFVLLSEKDCVEFGCEEACKEDKNAKECKDCKLSCIQ